MFYEIKLEKIIPLLQEYQRDLSDIAFQKHKVSTGEIDRSIGPENLFANVFPYPLRFLFGEKFFHELSSLIPVDPELHERTLQLIVINDYHEAIGIKIYKTDPNLVSPIRFLENTVLEKNQSGFDLLLIAGALATFPGSNFSSENPVEINDNFNELPYSARRFLIENILLGSKPSEGLFFLENVNYLKNIMPEVTAGKNLSQNKFHKYDIFEHLVRSCDAMEIPDLVMRFSSLLHDIGKVPTRKLKENGEATFYNHEIVSSHMLVPIMKRFGIPKTTGIKVKYYVRNHMFHYTDEWSDKAVRRFLRKVSREDLENLILLRKSDRLGSGKKDPYPKKLQKLIDHIEDVIMRDMEMKVTDLEIGGKDLMDMGLREGPQIGIILNRLLNEVKNEETPNTREVLFEKARILVEKLSSEILT
jgi:hypothetical protein